MYTFGLYRILLLVELEQVDTSNNAEAYRVNDPEKHTSALQVSFFGSNIQTAALNYLQKFAHH